MEEGLGKSSRAVWLRVQVTLWISHLSPTATTCPIATSGMRQSPNVAFRGELEGMRRDGPTNPYI